MSDLFFLQDSRSNVGSRAMFWREGGGYTSNLNEAEQFKRESAVKQYECRETDLPWPVEYVRTRAEVGVDCQYLTKSEAEAYRNEDGRVYVAYAREWDGNDLVWRGGKGPTGNLDDAIHTAAADAAWYLDQDFEFGHADTSLSVHVRWSGPRCSTTSRHCAQSPSSCPRSNARATASSANGSTAEAAGVFSANASALTTALTAARGMHHDRLPFALPVRGCNPYGLPSGKG